MVYRGYAIKRELSGWQVSDVDDKGEPIGKPSFIQHDNIETYQIERSVDGRYLGQAHSFEDAKQLVDDRLDATRAA